MFDRRSGAGAPMLKFLIGLLSGLLVSAVALGAQVNVTTARNEMGRTGQNLGETILTPANVNGTQFGKLFAQPVDGEVYAQPLYLSGLTINGTAHNVVFVATEHDSVYAFDADNTSGTNASPLWQASMLTAAHGAAPGATTEPWNPNSDVYPEIGIEGTPVIDPASGTIYLVSKTVEGGTAVERLHALDVTTGAEKFGGPTTITASVPGTGSGSTGTTTPFLPHYSNQRPGLLLLNGIVYIGFASHMDVSPWHGWVLAFSASTLQQTGIFCSTPNDNGGGIWMSGTGLAADQLDPAGHPFGRMFAPTGNGGFDAVKPFSTSMDYGDSILDLDLSNGVPTVVDDFTPSAQADYEANDVDVASGGLMILPTQTGPYPNLLLQAGKSGVLYILNRDNLGGYHATDQAIQKSDNAAVGALWSSPAYWNGQVYYAGQRDTLKSFPLVNGLLSLNSATRSQETFDWPGATPSISANGTTNGIAWTIDSSAYVNNGPSVLRAHDASNIAVTLYSSATNSSRDGAGPAVKFTVPTIANGKVYVGTGNQLDIYGLFSGSTQTLVPSFSPAAGAYAPPLSVTISDASPNSTIYYTTDGSPATISSNVYTGPISVASSPATINAIATAPGLLPSSQSSASYTINLPPAATPTFSPAAGTYTTAQNVTITDTTAGATIYYTTNGSTPTTASTVYTGPIPVSATRTIKAIAAASGFAASAVGSATYTINISQPTAATPTLAPAAGTYTTSQNVTITDTTAGATIYYTTNGSTPTTASTVYTGPVPVSATQTINAIAAASGYNNSAVATAAYTIGNTSTPPINFASGFTSTGLTFNGGTSVSGGALVVTDGGQVENRSAWYSTRVNVQQFTTDFNFQLTAATADGFTFAIQNAGPTAVGDAGGGLGYSGIGTSVAVKFDLFNGAGEGSDSTGFYINGASPTLPAVDMTGSGVDLHSGDTMSAHLVYDGTTLTLTITDTVTAASFTTSTAINIPATVGGSTAYVGFTGGTGGSTAVQKILSWTYSSSGSSGSTAAATPMFTPAGGSYTAAQSVTLTDSTPSATIYYTTDGSTPTTSSAVYSGAISVGATQTIKAIATATGFTASTVGSATYTINIAQPTAAPPTFSPVAGTYSTAQSVTLADTTAGATIYYTVDGSTPTTASTVYSAATSVSTTRTIKAIAAASGYTNSTVATGTYTIGSSGAPSINFPSGFTATGLSFNGGASVSGGTLVVTDGGQVESRSAWYSIPVNVQQFTTDFNFQLTAATADGFTFAIQNAGPTAVGDPGGGLGYSGIGTSVAVKFDLFNGGGEGSDSTGFYINGASPTLPAVDMTGSGVDLHSGDQMSAHLVYDGTTLTLTITDLATTASFTTSTTVNIPAIVGGSTAFVGFTGGTGGSTAVQKILNWTYSSSGSSVPTPAAAATFTPASGTYTAAQSVTLADSTPGASIYYTTDGSTPTTSSTVYGGAISVAATQTIKAIATATGFTASTVSSATYTINIAQPAAATPTFTPAAGTYTSAQSVTLANTTAGATIYYTTNGSTPTMASTVYSAAISVSATQTIKAIAAASGYTTSAVASATYTINATKPTAATPTFTPAAGTYAAAQSVTLADATTGATIYYTTNGTTPTTSSSVYSAAIPVSASQTIKAIAAATGYNNSAVASAAYTITLPKAATPTFTPAAGTYTAAQSVTLADTTAGATIYYTVDGSTPTTASTAYSGAIPVGATQTIKAIAVASGFTTSAVGSATYTISLPKAATPTFTPAAGTYTSAKSVTLADTSAGATIYYTTDGSTPTTASAIYNGPITVSATQTIKAIATASGFSTSAVGSATYTISLPAAATPTFSPTPAVYAAAQTVSLSDSTSGATIYFTTDGSTPTTASAVYTAPVTVSATQTIKAIATAAAFSNSAVGTGSYTISNGTTPAVNYPSGFTPSGLSFNGGAAVSGTALVVTDGNVVEARSAWYSTPVNVQKFTTDFTFQLMAASADGFTFAIQNKGVTALGGAGGSLGYGGITSSVAVKLDLFNSAGEGSDSTGFYTNGTTPDYPAVDMTGSGVDLHSGDTMSAHLVYNGTTLTLTITDLVTSASFTTSTAINIPSVVGSSTAYVGFTGGTGGYTATQKVLSWTYTIN